MSSRAEIAKKQAEVAKQRKAIKRKHCVKQTAMTAGMGATVGGTFGFLMSSFAAHRSGLRGMNVVHVGQCSRGARSRL